MLFRRQSLWGDFPTRRLARKYQIEGSRTGWKLLQIGLFMLLSFLCYLLASQFVWKSVQVVGTSMEPTLNPGDHRLLNRLVYYCRKPHKGEVVVFQDPADSELSVKRIIGVPGDSITLRDGKIYVNSRPLKENYLVKGTRTFSRHTLGEECVVVPEDSFYLLGDNRERSADSRIYGPVPRENILGMLAN